MAADRPWTKDEHLRFDLEASMRAVNGIPEADWFTAQLFRLIAKADPSNRVILRSAFPDEVRVYEQWIMEREVRAMAADVVQAFSEKAEGVHWHNYQAARWSMVPNCPVLGLGDEECGTDATDELNVVGPNSITFTIKVCRGHYASYVP